jgi:hypothetical protein
MTNSIPPSLTADNLMKHMRVLCQEIGPRAPTSAAERRAAEYVNQTLRTLGLADFQEQPFRSHNSLGWVVVPATIAGMIAIPVGLLGEAWAKLVAAAVLLVCAYTYNRFFRVRPPWFEVLVSRGHSQNVIVTIPPAQPARRKLFVVGHLDSNKQRLVAPPPQPATMKLTTTASQIVTAVFGLLFLITAFAAPVTPLWLWILGGVTWLLFLPSLYQTIRDETQPAIEGANDNATAVSTLLGIGEALQAQPLQNTEVTLLFTGCEEVGCMGMENYLRQFRPSKADTFWIDLEMVGTGSLAYVTRHGVSYLTEYKPPQRMIELAERTASQHPELKVTGKDMLVVEEVSNLCHWGYDVICVVGYDAQGWLPNWHRVSDNLGNIEPETLSRAAQYTWHLMHTIDGVPSA